MLRVNFSINIPSNFFKQFLKTKKEKCFKFTTRSRLLIMIVKPNLTRECYRKFCKQVQNQRTFICISKLSCNRATVLQLLWQMSDSVVSNGESPVVLNTQNLINLSKKQFGPGRLCEGSSLKKNPKMLQKGKQG